MPDMEIPDGNKINSYTVTEDGNNVYVKLIMKYLTFTNCAMLDPLIREYKCRPVNLVLDFE